MSFAGYDVSVHEFPGECTGLEICGGRVLFSYGPRLAELESDHAKTHIEEATHVRMWYRTEEDVVYTSQEPLDDSSRPTLVQRRSIHDLANATSCQPYLASGYPAGDRHIYHDKHSCWVSVDREGRTTDFECKGRPVGDAEAVFFQTDGELLRMDPDLRTRVWSTRIPGRRPDRFYPITHNALVIIAMAQEDGGYVLVAVDKASGNEAWHRKFDDSLDSLRACHGRILAAERSGRMWVLDVATGAVLGSLQSRPGIGFLWSDGLSLFSLSSGERGLRVFSMDGQRMLQEIQLPKPYGFAVDGPGFRVGKAIALASQGEVYWICTSYGLLPDPSFLIAVLRPRAARFGTLPRNPETTRVDEPGWPVDVRVYRVPSEKKGKVHYHVTARAEHIDGIERFAQIGLRRVIAARIVRLGPDHRRDSRSDGRVLFSWTARQGEPARIERMLEEIRYSFRLWTDDWLKLSAAPMPESAPGEEQPIGTLIGHLHLREDSWFEKMPMTVTFLSGRALEARGRRMLEIRDLAVAYGKRQGRKRFRGAELAFRECSGLLGYSSWSDDRRRDRPLTEIFCKDFDQMTFEDFAAELRLGAAEAYRRIGTIFFDEQDCAEWFSYLGKLARNLCKKAPKDDPAVLALFELVDGLADEGRLLAGRNPLME